MTTAGMITGMAGGAALASGIYLMLKAVPAVSVGAVAPYLSRNTAGLSGRF
jgi:hypothetical protein